MKTSSKGIARICSLPDAIVLLTSAVVLAAKCCVLSKAADLSAVSFEGGFLRDFLNRPGGILEYCGLLLTQAGHFPAAGIILMLALMIWSARSCRRIYGHNPLIWLPALCMLVFWTGMDYNLHTMRAVGYAFSQMLGIAAACAVASSSTGRRRPALFGIFSLIVFYPLIGGYAVTAALSCAAIHLANKGKTGLKFLCLTVLFTAILPQIATRLAYTHTDPTFTYLAGMPYFDFNGNWTRWIPIAAACISLILLSTFHKTLEKPFSEFMSFILSALLATGLVIFTYKDRNFHAEIRMEQAIEANDWDKVIKIASGLEHPTRIGVMYRNIALLYKGELLEKIFTFSDDYSPIATKAPVSMTMVCAPVSFFYNGMLQF